MQWLIWLIAFLLGTLPTGYLVVSIVKGENIQKIGSGNIGSTNVGRVAGKKAALFTQAIDIGKGALATILALLWNRTHPTPYLLEIAALLVILGHNYTPFLRFRGGKGVNTTAGAFLPIFPWSVGLAFLVHLSVRKITGIVSVSSILAGITIIVSTLQIYGWSTRVGALIVAFVLVCWRHKDNINRLLHGSEAHERH